MNASDYQAAGLYDPDAENAADRLALLEFVAASGVTLEEMTEAEANGTLVMAAADQVVMPGERMSLREVARRADMSEEEAQLAWRVVGLGGTLEPDEPYFVDGTSRPSSTSIWPAKCSVRSRSCSGPGWPDRSWPGWPRPGWHCS